jgi:hypothetical protein
MPGMAQLVSENGRAEAWRQRDAAIIPDRGEPAVDAGSVV